MKLKHVIGLENQSHKVSVKSYNTFYDKKFVKSASLLVWEIRERIVKY